MLVSEAIAIASRMSDSSPGDFDTQELVIPFINQGQRRIAFYTDCLEKEDTTNTTTAGTNSYAEPSDLWKMRRLELAGKKCLHKEYSEYQDIVDAGVAQDRVIWTRFADTIKIYSGATITAGVTLGYYYYRKPTDVTAENSTIDLPGEYADILPIWLAGRFYQANDENAMSVIRFQETQVEMNNLRQESRRIRNVDPRKVKQALSNRYDF